jgi:hypothetical protein
MTTIIRGLAAAAVLAGAAVGLASPRGADEVSGTYKYIAENGGYAGSWSITSCGPDCAAVQTVEGWFFTANAKLSGGRWNMTVEDPQGMVCSARDLANKYPIKVDYSWDAVTLQGTSTSTNPTGACGKPVGDVNTATFSLVKV